MGVISYIFKKIHLSVINKKDPWNQSFGFFGGFDDDFGKNYE